MLSNADALALAVSIRKLLQNAPEGSTLEASQHVDSSGETVVDIELQQTTETTTPVNPMIPSRKRS